VEICKQTKETSSRQHYTALLSGPSTLHCCLVKWTSCCNQCIYLWTQRTWTCLH